MAYTTTIGFPVRNDGSLQYNEDSQRYEISYEKLVDLAKCINRCCNAFGVGRIKDDRRLKHPRSLAKDRAFIEETERANFDNLKEIADIVTTAMQHGSFQKCDVNHNKEKGIIDYAKAKFIFAYTVKAYYVGVENNRDIYVKISFTRTGKGLFLHLESLHF